MSFTVETLNKNGEVTDRGELTLLVVGRVVVEDTGDKGVVRFSNNGGVRFVKLPEETIVISDRLAVRK